MSKEWESFSEVGIDVPSTESAAMISSQVSTGKKTKMPTRKILIVKLRTCKEILFGDFIVVQLYFMVISV